jgi:hypothetical protein
MSLPAQNLTSATTNFSPTVGTPSESAHPQVIEITKRLFGGPVSIVKEPDPEIDAEYFVVSTPAQGTVEELVSAFNTWHREIRTAIGNAISDYRLSIDPR